MPHAQPAHTHGNNKKPNKRQHICYCKTRLVFWRYVTSSFLRLWTDDPRARVVRLVYLLCKAKALSIEDFSKNGGLLDYGLKVFPFLGRGVNRGAFWYLHAHARPECVRAHVRVSECAGRARASGPPTRSTAKTRYSLNPRSWTLNHASGPPTRTQLKRSVSLLLHAETTTTAYMYSIAIADATRRGASPPTHSPAPL